MTTYTIKPLAWEQDDDGCVALMPLSRYAIFAEGREFSARVTAGIESGGLGYYETLEAAKQACAEHWEGMIKAALVPA